VKLACERYRSFWDSDIWPWPENNIFFDPTKASLPIEFAATLTLWKGGAAGKPFVLPPHFKFILWNIYGWYKGNGNRLIQNVYIEMGRKGAKSHLGALFLLYELIVGDEQGGELYTAAVKKDQAAIVYRAAEGLLRGTQHARLPHVKILAHTMVNEKTWSKCAYLSSEYQGLDGLDTSCAIIDELHAHPNSKVFDLVNDSTGARDNPLVITITTAGTNRHGVCKITRDYLSKILQGVIEEDSFFGIIYTLDMKIDWPDLEKRTVGDKLKEGKVYEDDWQDPKNWIKPNPGLYDDDAGPKPADKMTKISSIAKEAKKAKHIPSALPNFLTKRMSVWCSAAEKWLSPEIWAANSGLELKPAGHRAFCGVDLSGVSDFSCAVWTWEQGGLICAKLRAWIPEAKLADEDDPYQSVYQSWVDQGVIKVTAGNAVDHKTMMDDIVSDIKTMKIKNPTGCVDLGFAGYEFITKLNKKFGGTIAKPRVTGLNTNKLFVAVEEFEKLLVNYKFNHCQNPVFTFCADNVSLRENANRQRLPTKLKEGDKIDGIVALLFSLDLLFRARAQVGYMPGIHVVKGK
jgi:phage terminase large subunit-like protein